MLNETFLIIFGDLDFMIFGERPILDLVWNLPALDVKLVPECGTDSTIGVFFFRKKGHSGSY